MEVQIKEDLLPILFYQESTPYGDSSESRSLVLLFYNISTGFVVPSFYNDIMAKMNWSKVQTQNRLMKESSRVATLIDGRHADNRTKQKRKYGWWTQYGEEWWVAIDSEYTIGPERLVDVRKANGTIVQYILGDIPERTIEYDGGSYGLFKVKKP